MAEVAKESKKAAPRNVMEAFPLTRTPPELSGRTPGFRYERFSKNLKNPSSVYNKTRAHSIGDPTVGWINAPAWEVVTTDNDPNIAVLNEREDVGKGLSTAIESGQSVTCRIPEDIYAATYGRIEALRNSAGEAAEAARAQGEAQGFEANSRTFHRTVLDGDAAVGDLLKGVK